MSFGEVEGGYASMRGGLAGGSTRGGPSSTGRDGDSEYIRLNNEVTGALYQISQSVTSISKLISQLGTTKDSPELRQRLHTATDSARDLARRTGQNLKKMGGIDGGSAVESRQRRMQQQKLGKDFQAVMKKFAEVCELSAQKERSYVVQAKRRATMTKEQVQSTRQELAHAAAEEEALVEEERMRTQVQRMEDELTLNEAIIEEREQGIRQIEATMTEINEIFVDLAGMVTEQGTMIDSIEANLASASTKVESAGGELSKASEYQRAQRKKLFILLMLVLCILLAIAIAVPVGINISRLGR